MFKTIKVVGLETVVATCDWCDDAAMNADDENHEWLTYELETGPEHMCPDCQASNLRRDLAAAWT